MCLLRLFSLIILLVVTSGHTFLTDPDAYNRVFQLPDCKGRECKQACPSIPQDPRNTEQAPAQTWKRGQHVTIRWAKNNHATGFVRFALVPVRVMMKRYWHRRLSIYDGCWAQGIYNCEGDLCGSDNSGTGFQRVLRIPRVFPDGDYVFGMVWYGGVKSDGQSFWSDYWSCSYVRIQGGSRLRGKYRAYFETGETLNSKEKEMGMCYSAIDAPGVCPNNGCTGPAAYMLPRRYQQRPRPGPIRVRDVLRAIGTAPSPSPSTTPTPSLAVEIVPIPDMQPDPTAQEET